MKNRSYIIKAALFATGLSGIVAEYVLATLASYFIGDSVIQWTLIISLMLFFMGIGARITKYIDKNVFEYFVFTEFVLSFVVSFSAMMTYSLTAFSDYTGFLIYFLAILTGTLIGMELPLAIRLNERYEDLKFNVSGVLEKDYYGSLFGGVFFAFVGLPHLGLTYTPFVLGFINLAVAIAMLNLYPGLTGIRQRILFNSIAASLVAVITVGVYFTEDIIFYGEQKKYKDKVILSKQSKYQKIVITEWKDKYWLYLNSNLQFSSYDEALYHEVLVHPPMLLHPHPQNVLVLGGGDGCAVREILKHKSVQRIDLVDLDPEMTRLAMEHEVLLDINQSSLLNKKVKVANDDAYRFLDAAEKYYDVIIIDLPDPRNVELARMYSLEFYTMCNRHLRPGGILITQAGSPYFASESFKCINATMQAANFTVVPLHNQVVTMGEWGWVLGMKTTRSEEELLNSIQQLKTETVDTRWLNNEALMMITSFGKDYFAKADTVEINKIHDPILYHYYLNGAWDLY